MATLTVIVQITSAGEFAVTEENRPWLIPELESCIEELITGHPVVMDVATWQNHNRRPLPNCTVVLVDEKTTSIDTAENTLLCPTIDSAVSCSRLSAKEMGVDKVFVFGDLVLFDRVYFRSESILTIEIDDDELGSNCPFPSITYGFERLSKDEWRQSSDGRKFRIVEWVRRH